MADLNRAMTDKAIRALERRLEEDRKVNWPAALRRVGREIIEHSKNTHEYISRTGDLERSHAFIVVEPGKSEQVEIDTGKGSFTVNLSSPQDEIHLFLYTKLQRGLWLEIKYGLSVLVESFLKLRREFKKLFGDALRSGRVR